MAGLLLLVRPGCAETTAEATAPSFDRYAVILDRKPFGDEAAAAAEAAARAAASPAAVAESFAKNLKLCAITRNHFNGKVQVGIQDLATKKSYFLYEGDSEDGILLVTADYKGEKALLRKGSEEVWMDMNAAPTVVVARPPAPGGSRGPAARTTAVVNRSAVPAGPPPEPPKTIFKTQEDLEKHLKDYQMDLIRAGGDKGPPLPMELTPEMDEQLVKEGVLPPQE